jgi:4-amino-4-deoxy-L-arabinose transferase-like glycosyltransferase
VAIAERVPCVAQALRRSWPRRSLWPHLAVSGLIALVVVVLAATTRAYLQGARSYVDNGDGYYLYAAHRLAQGAVLYRDVMGTQPPLVYALGAAVFKLGGTLATLRLASAALRALCTVLVFLAGLRLFGDRLTAALAALTYALLPIGLVWDRSFDVNPPLTLMALLALWPLVHFTPRAARLAGVLAAVALFTKNLYAPLLVATLAYLALRRRPLLRPYLQGVMVGLAALGAALAAYAGSAGLHDAFLGQQSSPINPAWFVVSVSYVITWEGAVVLVAIVGACLCWRESRSRRLEGALALDYAPWFLGGGSAVLLATLKEGTFGTVFQVAEPAVALLAAYGAMWAVRPRARDHGPAAHAAAQRTARRPAVALALPAAVLVALASLASADRAALAQGNAAEVARVVAMIRAHTQPGATIVAPPYYALLTGTRIPGDAADTYILAQRVRHADPWAIRWVRQVTRDLGAHRIPIVLTDVRSGTIAPLMAALRAGYRPVYGDPLPPALHVEVWLPKLRDD